MKIPSALPQFKGAYALFIVAGKQEAFFYAAGNGALQKINWFKIPTPHYSDNEGLFKARSKNGAQRSGSPRENLDEVIIRDFMSEFKKRIKTVRPAEYEHLYIFAAPNTKNKLKEALPASWKDKLDMIFEGNYYHEKPIDLVKKIAPKEDDRVILTKPEAQKILNIKRPHTQS